VPLLHIAILALVQGITEFLPISSSGHLVLVPVLLDWPDQGLVIDVAVHVGILGAVMLYFWRDVALMIGGLGRLATGRLDGGGRLAAYVIVVTIPVIIAGFALNHFVPGGIRSIEVIAWTTLGFGILLYLADRMGMTLRRMDHMGFADAVIIGVAQVLALIPGTSRSGITMTAARGLGFERPDAARFSMLLSMPAILGAGVLKGVELYQSGDATLTVSALIAAGLALISALIAIWAMMAWLRRSTFTPFVVYRVLLGAFLLDVAYGVAG